MEAAHTDIKQIKTLSSIHYNRTHKTNPPNSLINSLQLLIKDFLFSQVSETRKRTTRHWLRAQSDITSTCTPWPYYITIWYHIYMYSLTPLHHHLISHLPVLPAPKSIMITACLDCLILITINNIGLNQNMKRLYHSWEWWHGARLVLGHIRWATCYLSYWGRRTTCNSLIPVHSIMKLSCCCRVLWLTQVDSISLSS